MEPEPAEELVRITPAPTEVPERSGDTFSVWSLLPAIPFVLFIAAILVPILRQKNILVYVPGDNPKEYRLIAKFRGSARTPYIDISGVSPRPEGNVAIEIKQPLAKKLLGRNFTVHCGERAYTYRVRRDQPSDWHEYNVETLEEVRI